MTEAPSFSLKTAEFLFFPSINPLVLTLTFRVPYAIMKLSYQHQSGKAVKQ